VKKIERKARKLIFPSKELFISIPNNISRHLIFPPVTCMEYSATGKRGKQNRCRGSPMPENFSWDEQKMYKIMLIIHYSAVCHTDLELFLRRKKLHGQL